MKNTFFIITIILLLFSCSKKRKKVDITVWYPDPVPLAYFNPLVTNSNDDVIINISGLGFDFNDVNDTLFNIYDSFLFGTTNTISVKENKFIRIVLDVPFKFSHTTNSYYQLRPEVFAEVDGIQYTLQEYDSSFLVNGPYSSNRLVDWRTP
mgnify:CR=1 FL=1